VKVEWDPEKAENNVRKHGLHSRKRLLSSATHWRRRFLTRVTWKRIALSRWAGRRRIVSLSLRTSIEANGCA
jgi:hypothetical protein